MPLTRIRALVLENLSWKLLALSLALLIWSGARLFMHQEVKPPLGAPTPSQHRDFANLPIRLLCPATNAQPWIVDPPAVFVRVSGDGSLLERLTDLDLIAFVESPPPALQSATVRRVDVRLPPAVRLASIIPERVELKPAPAQAQVTP